MIWCCHRRDSERICTQNQTENTFGKTLNESLLRIQLCLALNLPDKSNAKSIHFVIQFVIRKPPLFGMWQRIQKCRSSAVSLPFTFDWNISMCWLPRVIPLSWWSQIPYPKVPSTREIQMWWMQCNLPDTNSFQQAYQLVRLKNFRLTHFEN